MNTGRYRVSGHKPYGVDDTISPYNPRRIAAIPFFMKRCALTRDLFNLIIEFRLKMTSAGLSENIRREYHLSS